MPQQTNKSLKQLMTLVDKFNYKYQIGHKVDLLLDNGNVETVTVKHKASILNGHSAVGWFEEISGCYSLDRVVFKKKSK